MMLCTLSGTKCSFKNFSDRKIRFLDRYKYPKKTFFEFFFRFFCVFVTVPNAKKCYFWDFWYRWVVLFRVWDRYKDTEKSKKIFKKIFFWIFIPKTLFFDLKNFWSCIWYLVLPSKKYFFKTMVVPGTKFGVFR
jgi:hypothetical protein